MTGYTSTHVVSEVAHRLMTLEASAELSRPAANVLQHLRRHPATVQRLRLFRQAIDAILDSAIHILPISPRHLGAAALVSQETGLLSNDALIVALMRQCGLTNLASHDADFDRVPDIERFWP